MVRTQPALTLVLTHTLPAGPWDPSNQSEFAVSISKLKTWYELEHHPLDGLHKTQLKTAQSIESSWPTSRTQDPDSDEDPPLQCVYVCVRPHIYYLLSTKFYILPAKWSRVGKVRVGVRGFVGVLSVMYYACESPHRDRWTRMCVCVCVCGLYWYFEMWLTAEKSIRWDC